MSLFGLPTTDLESYVLEHDVIWVGGGNTRAMLALWREFGLDKILKQAWREGVVLSGVSAGAVCWFAQGMSDAPNRGTKLLDCRCLGVIPHSGVVHFTGSTLAKRTLKELVQSGKAKPGYAIEDDVALHFVGTELKQAVSLRKGQGAYRATLKGNKAAVERVRAKLL